MVLLYQLKKFASPFQGLNSLSSNSEKIQWKMNWLIKNKDSFLPQTMETRGVHGKTGTICNSNQQINFL